jgi:uncharacterized membrane protein YqaE (UPF0057 family)
MVVVLLVQTFFNSAYAVIWGACILGYIPGMVVVVLMQTCFHASQVGKYEW